MFALPGITLLIIFLLARPQEFFVLLQRMPFLHLAAVFAILGYLVDLRLRRLQPVAVNTLPWVIAFFVWAMISTAINVPEQLPTRGIEFGVLFTLYGTLAHGVQRFRTFQYICGVVAVTCLVIAGVCFHQGLSPHECIGGEDTESGLHGKSDGRACETVAQCLGPDAEPGLEYRCERVGLVGTYTVEGRVRYRGELHDPNEVALTISAGGMALLIAFMLRKRGAGWKLLLVASVGIVIVTVFMTESRGGLIALLIVPGIYLLRRYGLRALVPAAAVAVPVLLLGGRSGASADESTAMRYDAWSTAVNLWHHSPAYGVGPRMFTDHFFITAHNSYVLVLAELGIVGLYLFVAILYLVFKTLILGLVELGSVPGAVVARVWGLALLAAMCGVAFQISTLSFSYHSVLWLMLGLVGAWYSCVRHHRPELKVRLTMRDLVIVGCMTIGFAVFVLPFYLKMKGFL